MHILGIDPGFSGAWAIVIDGRPHECGDLPSAGEGTRKRISGGVLGSIIRSYEPSLCVIERATVMPKQGIASGFRYGMAFGAVIACVETLGIPFELVTPQVWKRSFGLIGQPKEASRQKALDRAPSLAHRLDRKRDDGRAEAVLIGLYGYVAFDIRSEAA